MSFDRVAVIGVGLIGGSFALALKRHGLAGHVVGVARREQTLLRALERGVADSVTTDPAHAAEGADLVYIAAPVGATAAILQAVASVARPDTIITDAGSTKAAVVAAAREHIGAGSIFIPGHPMAGSEQSGPVAARADLFEGKVYFLTPATDTPEAPLERLRDTLLTIGARVVICEPERHDRLLAATSHLPHFLASVLASVLAERDPAEPDFFAFCGSGVRDMTRLAKGPPEVWRDIFLDNRDHLRAALARLNDHVERYLAAIEAGDGEALEALLDDAREFRKGLDD